MLMLPKIFTVALLAFISLGSGPLQDEGVQIGDAVTYTFRTPPAKGMGVSALSDLLGKPVLLEFWGHR